MRYRKQILVLILFDTLFRYLFLVSILFDTFSIYRYFSIPYFDTLSLKLFSLHSYDKKGVFLHAFGPLPKKQKSHDSVKLGMNGEKRI